MRVLVVRIGAMGDVLHAMPAVAALRRLHPEWFIGWAIEPRWSGLLQMAGDREDISQGLGRGVVKAMVDRWYQVPTERWKQNSLSNGTLGEIGALRRVLQAERFDICVDMQGALKSAVVGRMAGAKVFAGSEEPRERAARWMYGEKVNVVGRHVVEQGCVLLGSAVGEVLRPGRVPLPMNEMDEHWAATVVSGERIGLVSPTAGWGAKVWPAERFGSVATALGRAGLKVLVNAAPGKDKVAEQVVAGSKGQAMVVPCNLGRLIALTRRAAVVIAGDTGPLHLAAALERPVVGIYGPTDPKRNGPWACGADAARVRVLRDTESVTSHKRVGETEAGMLRIGVEEVVQAALDVAE